MTKRERHNEKGVGIVNINSMQNIRENRATKRGNVNQIQISTRVRTNGRGGVDDEWRPGPSLCPPCYEWERNWCFSPLRSHLSFVSLL